MKAKIFVLGDISLVHGLKLIGIDNYKITDGKKFQSDFESILTKEEFGVVVISEKYLENIDWKLKKKLETIAHPVIVPIPNEGGKNTEGEQIRNLIKRALGFDLGKK